MKEDSRKFDGYTFTLCMFVRQTLAERSLLRQDLGGRIPNRFLLLDFIRRPIELLISKWVADMWQACAPFIFNISKKGESGTSTFLCCSLFKRKTLSHLKKSLQVGGFPPSCLRGFPQAYFLSLKTTHQVQLSELFVTVTHKSPQEEFTPTHTLIWQPL